jgi:hypothetical protein
MKRYYFALGSLQLITALGAIPAGLGYLSDVSGRGMGVTTELLANSPLKSFLLPGLFLLFVNGIGHAAGAWCSFRMLNAAGMSGIVLGTLLSLWIIIQVYWIGYGSMLQPLFLVIGLTDTYLGWIILKKNLQKSMD